MWLRIETRLAVSLTSGINNLERPDRQNLHVYYEIKSEIFIIKYIISCVFH